MTPCPSRRSRAQRLPLVAIPIAVANEDHRILAVDQLLEAGIKDATIVLEPLARNAAPAIAPGAMQASQRNAYAALLVLLADHLMVTRLRLSRPWTRCYSWLCKAGASLSPQKHHHRA